MTVYESDSRGNPVHYGCVTVLGHRAEVQVEYDYSNPSRVDAHIYRMSFPESGHEIVEPRKWQDGNDNR